MLLKLHAKATTTPKIRLAIQESNESINSLAKQYNLSWSTVKKWKSRSDSGIEDKTSKPIKLRTDLSKLDEEKICFERKQFKKTIDDIFLTLEDEINNLYPVKVYRCLKRYGLNVLPNEFTEAEIRIKKFKNYGIGYLHIDLFYAPKIDKKRHYAFTCIDRVSKIAYIMITDNKRKDTGAEFLKQVLQFYPYKINYILTDNGLEFCYKALPEGKQTKKIHPFDEICNQNKINHRTIKFKSPWTNGMVERFNRTVKDGTIKRQQYQNLSEMTDSLIQFVDNYNHFKRLKSLDYLTPAQYIKNNNGKLLQRIVS